MYVYILLCIAYMINSKCIKVLYSFSLYYMHVLVYMLWRWTNVFKSILLNKRLFCSVHIQEKQLIKIYETQFAADFKMSCYIFININLWILFEMTNK